MSIAAVDNTAVTTDENVRIELANGVVFDADFETLAALHDKLSDNISTAYEKRLTVRRQVVNPSDYGFIPVDNSDISEANVWALPGAFGSLPHGVPLLRFTRSNIRAYRWNMRRNRDENSHETWNLSFSNYEANLGSVRWDDLSGFDRLATSLRDTPLDVLLVEALLSGGNTETNPRAMNRVNDINAFIDQAVDLPVIDTDMYGTHTGDDGVSVTLSPVHIVHPRLCRYVNLPGLVAVTNTHLNAPDIDKRLSAMGLLGVPTARGGGFRYTRVTRIAVKRGNRSRLGTLAAPIAEAIGNAHDHIARGETNRSNSDVVLSEPMAFDEWQAALA